MTTVLRKRGNLETNVYAGKAPRACEDSHQQAKGRGLKCILPLQPSEGPNLDLRLLAPRAVRQYISVVSTLPVCGTLFQQPYQTNTRRYHYYPHSTDE